MVVLRLIKSDDDQYHSLGFRCPGCKCFHYYRVKGKTGPVWQWNGDPEKPTFTPSLLYHATEASPKCHIYLTNGIVSFLDDCGHELKGTQYTLPPV